MLYSQAYAAHKSGCKLTVMSFVLGLSLNKRDSGHFFLVIKFHGDIVAPSSETKINAQGKEPVNRLHGTESQT